MGEGQPSAPSPPPPSSPLQSGDTQETYLRWPSRALPETVLGWAVTGLGDRETALSPLMTALFRALGVQSSLKEQKRNRGNRKPTRATHRDRDVPF